MRIKGVPAAAVVVVLSALAGGVFGSQVVQTQDRATERYHIYLTALQAVQQALGDHRLHQRAPRSHGLDCIHQLIERDVLQQVTTSASLEPGQQQLIVIECGQDNRWRQRVLLAQLDQHVQPGQPGHAHVQQHHVGLRLGNQLDRAGAVSLNAGAPLTTQFFIEDHPLRHSWHHLARIRNAVASASSGQSAPCLESLRR